MLNKIKPKSKFSRNILTLMTGTTIAQAIPIAISPILTRIYTPEDFGVFALYMSFASVLSVIATGKYELAIMLPKHNKDAANVVALSLFIALCLSIFVFLIILIFNQKIIDLLGKQELSNVLYFIPLTILLTAIYQSFNYWNNRISNYTLMSKTIVLQSSSNAISNISFGFLQFGFIGLIFTNIITNIISVFYIFKKNDNSIKKYKKNISIKKIIIFLIKYKQFPYYTLPQNILYQGTLQLPIFAIKSFFTFSVLGAFSLAYRVVATPLSIISNSLGQVYYQKASRLYLVDKIELYRYTKNLFYKLLFLSLILGIPISFYLPSLFSFIFGKDWIIAGNIAQFLMIYLIFDFGLTPFTKLYLISNNNIFYLKWEITRFIIISVFIFFIYFYEFYSINIFFLLFSLINLLLYIYLAIPIIYKKSFLWSQA